MKRTLIFAPLLLIALTIVILFGIGVPGASAATVTRYQQNASQLSYSGTWTVSSATAASGGSFRYANASGASVTATFDGTYLAWIAKKSASYGIAKVTLDGTKTYSIDLYNGTAVYQRKVWETGTLDSGVHTVKIEWTGTRNGAATNTNIGVDAFDVAGSLVGVTRWSRATSTSVGPGTGRRRPAPPTPAAPPGTRTRRVRR